MKTTLTEVIRIISAAMAEETAKIAIHDTIAKVLAERRGKQINARLAGIVAKALGWEVTDPGAVHYAINAGSLVELTIWGKPSAWNYEQRVSFFLGYTGGLAGEGDRRRVNHPDYGPEAFEDTDNCHGNAAKARNAKRAAVLSNPAALKALAKAIDAKVYAEKHLKTLLDFEGDFEPDRYTLEKLAEIA